MTPSDTTPSAPPHPLIVALAAWGLPGLGYVLIGQKSRGITIGLTVVLLFASGLLIGGVRSLEVPTVEREEIQVQRLTRTGPRVEPTLMDEIRAKPWSIAQFFNGPVGFVGGYFSYRASKVDPEIYKSQPGRVVTAGVESHARVNEIAVLYTAVAGMLNLLAIIDSAHRAGRMLEGR